MLMLARPNVPSLGFKTGGIWSGQGITRVVLPQLSCHGENAESMVNSIITYERVCYIRSLLLAGAITRPHMHIHTYIHAHTMHCITHTMQCMQMHMHTHKRTYTLRGIVHTVLYSKIPMIHKGPVGFIFTLSELNEH